MLTVYFAVAFAVVCVGNHFAIFWGVNGFQYWQLKHYLQTAISFEVILLVLAAVLAPLAAARYPDCSLVDRTAFAGMVICPALIVILTFGFLRLTGLRDEKTVLLLSANLVICEVLAMAYYCRKMIGGWRLTAALALVCAAAGVTASIVHIVGNSLVT